MEYANMQVMVIKARKSDFARQIPMAPFLHNQSSISYLTGKGTDGSSGGRQLPLPSALPVLGFRNLRVVKVNHKFSWFLTSQISHNASVDSSRFSVRLWYHSVSLRREMNCPANSYYEHYCQPVSGHATIQTDFCTTFGWLAGVYAYYERYFDLSNYDFQNNSIKASYLQLKLNCLVLKMLPPGYKVEEIEIPVPWGHVAGRWWGPRDKQPVIAIHGWQDNAGTWDNLIPLLPVTTSVLCIDLPGHGLSTHYPKGMLYYIFWDGIVLLRRIVKHFDWSKITLMGHSLGGALSFMYAASFPDDVEKIICVDIASPAVREPSTMVKGTGQGIDKVLEYENLPMEKVPCYEYEEMIDIVCEAYKGSISRENCKVLMKRGMMPTPAHLKKKGYFFRRDPKLKVSGLAMMSIETALEYASKVKCKVLNIRALPGQRWEKLDYYLSVVEKMKSTADVRYVEVEGTHHIHLEDPDKIAHIVEDFLEDY
ncbi:hypothetical protein SFRURICE_007567 [Spodoptera frugiperda]|nr:hypothetical protein SFRURICE_007567 [Spodoptera frugiperda]